MVGIGVLINTLCGSKATMESIKKSLNKKIEDVTLNDNRLVFRFEDNTALYLYDDGQCCCEYRYMRTDDDLSEFRESVLLDFELKNAPDIEDGGEVHEVQFLDIKTSKGIFQVCNHNEHNGYYGGFFIAANFIEL